MGTIRTQGLEVGDTVYFGHVDLEDREAFVAEGKVISIEEYPDTDVAAAHVSVIVNCKRGDKGEAVLSATGLTLDDILAGGELHATAAEAWRNVDKRVCQLAAIWCAVGVQSRVAADGGRPGVIDGYDALDTLLASTDDVKRGMFQAFVTTEAEG
jgi:hypothetical protein